MRILCCLLLCLSLPLFFLSSAPSQDKKADKKDTPKVVVAVPFGIPAGVKTTVTIRGLKLDTATEVRFAEPKVEAKISKKVKAPPPNNADPNKLGDSFLEVEVTLPPDLAQPHLEFIIVTPAGESPAHRLLIDSEPFPSAEKEPNNGFKQAQRVSLPLVIAGSIPQSQDVDVFRIDGQQGQKIVAEVFAARHGAPLDAILTLYDAAGQILASNDDIDGSTDSRLEVTLPAAGVYYLNLADAHDQGGPAFVYRLKLETGR
jgi:hypothetical protein